jgi:CBS domain containing-hemolysin-like protein
MTANWLLLGLVFVLLAASAFFVAAEFALIAARRTIIEPMAVTSARARSTLKAMEQVSLMMACAQLGITLCGVLLGALGEPAVAALLEPVFASLGVPESWLHPVSLVVALTLVVSAHVAFGEMVPKNIAIAGPEQTALMLAPALRAVAKAIGPIIRTLNRLANAVVRLTGREPKDEVASAFTREEVAELVAESRREGLLDDEEHQRITSALDFDTATVTSVMVPDSEVVSVRPGVTAAEVERICARTGFSRFPILGADGRFSGYLHIRDVVDIPAERRNEPVPTDRIRALPSVVPDVDLRTALDRMRRIGAHLAEVADTPRTAGAVDVSARQREQDELDGMIDVAEVADRTTPDAENAPPVLPSARGVVMLEDVIEALIGEIRDATRRAPDRAPHRGGAT